ncbi:MAG: DUF4388 domain-containing protein [Myxococcota bacterium]
MNSMQNNLHGSGHSSAIVIDTTDEPAVIRRAQSALRDSELKVVSISQLKESNDWDTLSRVCFVLAEWSGDESAPLRTATQLASIHLLPVLAFGSTAPAPKQLEAMRQAGVSTFLDTSKPEDDAARALLRSGQWFTSQLNRVSVPDTIQLLTNARRSGVLVLTCPHIRPLSARAWHETASQCTDDDSCPGAVARVYLFEGLPVHAETPTSVGLHAFTDCLSFQAGIARFCEVYLPPGQKTLDGTAPQLLIQAATIADEAARGAPTPPTNGVPDMNDNGRSGPPALPVRVRPNSMYSPAQRLKELNPHASLIVCTDHQGEINDMAGDGDADGIAALASITSGAFEKTMGELGLGRLEGWSLAGKDLACIAATGPDEIVTALMPAPRDGFRKLDELLRANNSIRGANT